MLPFPSYYGFDTWSSGNSYNGNNYFMHGLNSSSSTTTSMEMIIDGSNNNNNNGGITTSSTISSRSTAENKVSHSEAERRRRERINGHLATLRTLLPNTIKTDKASLLAEVVQHVKELKKIAGDVAGRDSDGCKSEWWPFPPETDELTITYCEPSVSASDNHGLLFSSSITTSLLIRVSLSCDDRPDLMADLTHALKSVEAKVLKAEITTIGGRMKSILVIQSGGVGGRVGGDLGTLRRALKAVLDKPLSSPLVSGNMVLQGHNSNSTKRQRFSQRLGSSSSSHNDF